MYVRDTLDRNKHMTSLNKIMNILLGGRLRLFSEIGKNLRWIKVVVLAQLNSSHRPVPNSCSAICESSL